ncbi:hypothetical protein FUAX_05250 [Fulvitalea axinellae]|uniref:SMODS-associating 2TM beta-strand rich effector domain-containing protein n=1 Tax=Fulvitalea axinellae TaxID=1182444 RepID=A0AAU9CWX5_9BACT|nr:hypothetical protein FUAX_05250 [Fulvitalea axinellae]
MESRITAAVITGISTIVATLLGGATTWFWTKKNKGTRNLASVINGEWKGLVIEDIPVNGKTKKYDVSWHFVIKRRKIICDSVLEYRENKREEIHQKKYLLHGRITHDKFIMLDYYMTDNNQVNFGTEVIEINPVGDVFKGKYVGFSSKQEKILTGKIYAKRIKS